MSGFLAVALTLGLQARPVIIAPAQFAVPRDYERLAELLVARGHAVYVAPLTRLSWLRIVPASFTPAFWRGELRPTPTLGFFYEALDKVFAQVEEAHQGEKVSVIGHSIGGWVARAYIGERLGEHAAERVERVVTLGTPHREPPSESLIDQTRGLLRYINAEFPSGAPLNPEQFVCVAGAGTKAESVGELVNSRSWDPALQRSPLLERLVALGSYLALSGKAFDTAGDGLIPVETATMAPECPQVILDDCHHSGFIPTALDSIVLPESYPWYGSEAMVELWADNL